MLCKWLKRLFGGSKPKTIETPVIEQTAVETTSKTTPKPKETKPALVFSVEIQKQLKRLDESKIYPPFLVKYKQLLQNCLYNKGAAYIAISGLRSFEEQKVIYDKGRTTAGNIVTNAKPGESYHNYGLAIDAARDVDLVRNGLQPGWAMSNYTILAVECNALKLAAGYYFNTKDGPHVQMLLPRGVTLKTLKQKFDKGGLEKVWEYLDAIT